ncbi:CGI-121-domain-containing protein [Delitschia confertaspora ATCC 74209]|uniref:EKC/KEOPS complex subunit CGI121 n=1 Tax=Delitschia confertaspora ATCC 74209 TaxID=1513339 RepID=A0A9P4MW87_9PLEO|nr:CGI-121-domain-containing protein [Delitschia confertaspora ATCC 74209]
MATVRKFHLPHYPSYPIYISTFKNVENAAFLRSQLLEGNPNFDYAFLDASTILSLNHILLPAFLALSLHTSGRAKTKTVHSELVFRLHPNNNIAESFKKFGIGDSSRNIIAVKIGGFMKEGQDEVAEESVSRHLGEVVQGDSTDPGERGERLGEECEMEKVRKMYKLESGAGGGGKKGKKIGNTGEAVNGMGGEEKDRKEMESVVLGVITLKGS